MTKPRPLTPGPRFIRPHVWRDKVPLSRDDDQFTCSWCGKVAVRHSGVDIVNLPVEHCPHAPGAERFPIPAQLVATLARALHTSTLVGNAPPATKALGDRMRNPRIGDLVMETSSWATTTAYGHRDDTDGLGWLVSFQDEGRGNLSYTIEPIDRLGEAYTWNNASFVAVPTSLVQLDDWKGVSW